MGKTRRKYDPEFKLGAAKMVVDDGREATEVADRLGIHPGLLHNWKNRYLEKGEGAFGARSQTRPGDKELRDLKRELSRVRQERDILKKALAYFANDKR